MKSRKNRPVFFSIILLVFLCAHFTLLTLACAPDKFTTMNVKKIGQNYINPLFAQSWSLFVPVKSITKEILIGTTNNHGETVYQILATDAYSGRQRFYLYTILFHSLNDLDYTSKNEQGIYLVKSGGFSDKALCKILNQKFENKNQKLTHVATLIRDNETTVSENKFNVLVYKWPLMKQK